MDKKTEDLSVIAAKVREEYSRDGSLEFLMGLGVMMAGAFMNRRSGGSFVAFIPIFIIILSRAWKKTVTYPRLGYAEFSAALRAEKKRTVILVLLTIATLAVIVAFGYLSAAAGLADKKLSSLPHENLLIGCLIAFFFLAFAIFRKVMALYIIGALFLVSALAVDRGLFSFEDALLLSGFALMAVGVVRLLLFIRAHPRLESTGSHDSQ